MLFDLVDAEGDIQLLGLHVVGLHRVGVGRRTQQHAGVGLHVEGFVQAHQVRPLVHIHALRRGEDEGGAALGLQAQGANAGERGELVAPGAGGVDQHRRLEIALAGDDQPLLALALDASHFAAELHLPAVATDAAQVSLVQGVGVDVGGAGIEHGALDLVAAQYRHQRAGFVGAEHPHVGDVFEGAVELALQLFGVAAEVHHHLAARREQRMFAEAFRRCVEEGAAGGGQGAYLGRAVGHGIERGRAPGGVVAGVLLALQYQHPPVARQPVTGGGAGDPGTDDDEVGLIHGKASGGWK
ncbi:hypothetical protein D9M71_488880 [compost metagenome]